MKQLLLFTLVIFSSSPAFAQPGCYCADMPAIDPNVIQVETLYVHDTVFIADADKFLRKYYHGDITINKLVKDQRLLDSVLRNLKGVSGEQLFYNLFEQKHISRRLSNAFIVKEFTYDDDYRKPAVRAFTDPGRGKNLSRELLFRFDDPGRTARFLNDKEMQLKAISYMFTKLQEEKEIRSLDIYFPDFDYKEKRGLVQFMKSLRSVMRASKAYSSGELKLKVFLIKPHKDDPGQAFLYALALKADEVILFHESGIVDNFYIHGDALTRDERESLGFFTRMRSHFYLARFSTEDVHIDGRNIESFSVDDIREIALADLPQNEWEPYLWILIGIFVLILVMVACYFFFPHFSFMLNQNMGIVLMGSVVLTIEIIMLIGMIFQNMCAEDVSTSVHKNPSLLFGMPLLLVVVLPVVRQFMKSRKLP